MELPFRTSASSPLPALHHFSGPLLFRLAARPRHSSDTPRPQPTATPPPHPHPPNSSGSNDHLGAPTPGRR
eukprot:441032-Prorocentrum_lima.AAC.1